MDIEEAKKQLEEYKPTLFEKIYWPIWRKWDAFRSIPSEVKYFIQRGRRGYADRDAWDISYHLDSFMPELLRHMIDEKKGGGNSYPGEGTEGAETAKKWNIIVEKMAKGFEASRKMDEIEYVNGDKYRKEYKRLEKIRQEGMGLFVKYYNHLWD